MSRRTGFSTLFLFVGLAVASLYPGTASACWPYVSGRAECPDGTPLQGLNVSIQRDAEGGCGAGTYNTVTDENGEFVECIFCPGDTRITIGGQMRYDYVGDYTDFGTWILPCNADDDEDGVADATERYLAHKFSPVLHKHAFDSQADLADLDRVLPQSRLIIYDWVGDKIWDEPLSSSPLHASDGGYFCTMADDSVYGRMYIDLPDGARLQGAPVGQRPLYYHVYRSGTYLFLQYWYYFNFNDLRDHTNNHTWHEGDWEHVTLRLVQQGAEWVPDQINFYQHNGGHTRTPQQTWWSATNTRTYSGIRQGYAATHTHLHLWIAADSHATYNRYDPVYHIEISNLFGLGNDQVTDNVDYERYSPDLYFAYDLLKNMGEVETRPWDHDDWGRTFDSHRFHLPVDQEFQWLRYIGRIGDNWFGPFGCPWGNEKPQTPAPYTPATGELSHEWLAFTVNSSHAGFGNTGGPGCFLFSDGGVITWVSDPADGDGSPVDSDQDGYVVEDDCNDSNPLVNPGQPERCNTGYDDDCDGQINEGCPACSDHDFDGWNTCNGDCNDFNSAVNPGRPEACGTTYDDDCDGQINEGCSGGNCRSCPEFEDATP